MPAPSSKLPDGGVDPTFASNFLLDGFDFDTDYGAGPAAARTDPTLPRSQGGMSALPDGMTAITAAYALEGVDRGDEGGLGDLRGLFHEAAQLTDLRWLEEAEQDPARLPHSPHGLMFAELEEAWGVERRTDGRGLVPNNRDLTLEKTVSGPASQLPGAERLAAVVASAARRSAYGESLPTIKQAVAAQLAGAPEDSPAVARVAAALRLIEAEHGLNGRLYLRDSAWPGLLTGRWDRTLNAKCASARYWLTAPGSKLAAMGNYLGKRVVTEIPWGEALAVYRPMLELKGVRVAASGSARDRLTAALRARAVSATSAVPHREAAPTSTVTHKEALESLRRAPAVDRTPLAPKTSASALKVAARTLARWVKARLLTAVDARRLLGSGAEPRRVLRWASDLVVAAGHQDPLPYTGVGVGLTAARSAPTRDAVWASVVEAKVEAAALDRARGTVAAYRKAGLLTADETSRLLGSDLPSGELVRVATARARDVNRRVALPSAPTAPYQGPRYAAAAVPGPRQPKSAQWAQEAQTKVDSSVRAGALKALEGMVKGGRLTRSEADRLAASDLPARDLIRAANHRAEQEVSRRGVTARASVGEYRLPTYTLHAAPRHQALPVPAAPRPLKPRTALATPSSSAPVYANDLSLSFDEGVEFVPTGTSSSGVEIEFGGFWLESEGD